MAGEEELVASETALLFFLPHFFGAGRTHDTVEHSGFALLLSRSTGL